MEFLNSTPNSIRATIRTKTSKRELGAAEVQSDGFHVKKAKLKDACRSRSITSSKPCTPDCDSSSFISGIKTIATTSKIGEKSSPRQSSISQNLVSKAQYVRSKQRTVLRRDRPVSRALPYEFWQKVLSFSSPEFLHKVALYISPTCRRILMDHGESSEKLWRLARLWEYGPNHPDPPPNITERQYADL